MIILFGKYSQIEQVKDFITSILKLSEIKLKIRNRLYLQKIYFSLFHHFPTDLFENTDIWIAVWDRHWLYLFHMESRKQIPFLVEYQKEGIAVLSSYVWGSNPSYELPPSVSYRQLTLAWVLDAFISSTHDLLSVPDSLHWPSMCSAYLDTTLIMQSGN